MAFLRILVDSVVLLQRCPKLFIPKILVAFLLMPTFILVPHYIIQSGVFGFNGAATTAELLELLEAIGPLFLVLFYGFLINLADFFIINPMYPVMVKRVYDKKGVHFGRALFAVFRRIGVILPLLFTVMLITFATVTPVAILLTLALFLQSNFLLSISAIIGFFVVFVLFIVFYLIYPISSLEKFDFFKSLRETTRTSLKHKLNVSKVFLITISITGASYGFGLLIVWLGSPTQLPARLAVFGLFIFTRLMVSVFSTYQYVLNAVFYLGLEKNRFLRV